MTRRPSARPCSICQTERVIDSKVCSKCQVDFAGQENEPWYVYAIQNSDDTARLIRRKIAHEISLEVTRYHEV